MAPVAPRTESPPILLEPHSREDSMLDNDTDQESIPTASQPQGPWAGGPEGEATLVGSDSGRGGAAAPATVAEGSAGCLEAKALEGSPSAEPQVALGEPRAQEGLAQEEGKEPPTMARATRQQHPLPPPPPQPQPQKPLPWSEFEKAFTFVRQKGGSVLMQCNYCLPVIKNVSTAVNSSTNLRKHLEIMDFIVEETLPLEMVDRPSFVGLVRLGLPKCLTIMCSETLRESLERRASSMRERLVKRMGPVAYVATTADCWTDGRKSFLGVTAHWISPTTLEREFGALACRRLKGPHTTYEVLAEALRDIYRQYKVHHKVVSTTTDNGSNFVKAFPGGDPSKEEEEVKFVPISEILDRGHREKEGATDAEGLSLPPHQRCASHTLNLVATQDVEALLAVASQGSPLGPFKKHFSSLMAKCTKLWATLERCKATAESIHEQCGMYLKVPARARWTSVFEALKQLSDLLSAVPLKVDLITDQCSLERVTPAESLVLAEYTEILGPLAQSLEILQGENGMYMGYLLPTLYHLDRKLQGLEGKPARLAHGLPLVQGLRQALRKRFDHVWEDRKLLLAACLHPRFKVDWLESAQNAQANKSMMEALLKAEIRSATVGEGGGPSEKGREGSSTEDDFFSLRTRSTKPDADGMEEEEAEEEEEEEEVSRYLRSPVREVSSLHAFPQVLRHFLRHNTAMPSSAAVEYLFSTVGHVLAVKRPSLSDELFEQLVLLRQNRPVF
ncbi:hypothetical protein JRQ81_012307 [Phrynocephalus forsythii]|uniref:Transposase n=1 Tax=Phrynocephalus forsythii TaxID=171643 RepID=A0A9Q0X5L5_9SAUR|nr:hypothetical protein JRQ81_012307 [Phrynocephalus forsythii]